jgi:ABC-type oligopeptide transport system ATPase subunit
MEKGKVVEIGTEREILDTPRPPYTRRLLAAGLDPDPEVQKARRRALEPATGQAQDPNLITGLISA